MKIFKFLIINFLFINCFNLIASEFPFLGPDNVKTLGKVDSLFTCETLDESSQYISNLLMQLYKKPIFLNTIFSSIFSPGGAGHFLRMDDTIENTSIINELFRLNKHQNKHQNYVHTYINGGRIWTLFLFMNKECDLEIVTESYKKIIEELKHGWKKLPHSTYKAYVIEKSGSKNKFKLLTLLIEKFNLTGVEIVYDSDKSRILIPEDILEKAFLAFDFNISYSVEDSEKIEKLKKLLNLIVQNPDKTKSLIPVLSEIVLGYFITPAYLFKFLSKEIDDFVELQANINPNKKSLKRKGSFDKGEKT